MRCFGVLAIVLAALGASIAPSGAGTAIAFARTEQPAGLPYRAHVRHFVRWLLEAPADQSALADPANCDLRQPTSGAVAFLAPATDAGQSTTCHVTSDQVLVVSPAGGVAFPDPGEPYNPVQLLDEATASMAGSRGFVVRVDGNPVAHIRRDFRFRTLFGATFPADNIFGLPAGVRHVAFDGYVVVLHPLTVGHHEVDLSVSFPDGGDLASYDITIDVEVTA